MWLDRLKQRAASWQYTPAQEAARARAAQGIHRQQDSWWGGIANAVQDAWCDAMDGMAGVTGVGGSYGDEEVSHFYDNDHKSRRSVSLLPA